MSKTLMQLAVGDAVVRTMGGIIKMPMLVTEVSETRILCCPTDAPGLVYTFAKNGAEIDEDLGWNERKSGSVIAPA